MLGEEDSKSRLKNSLKPKEKRRKERSAGRRKTGSGSGGQSGEEQEVEGTEASPIGGKNLMGHCKKRNATASKRKGEIR